MPHDPTITVRLLTHAAEVDDDVVSAFAHLIPQLSTSAPPPTREQLVEMVESDCDHVLLAHDADGSVLGTMTLVLFRIPTGVRGWIEDVVVDEAARGRGVGEVLNTRALELAYERGARTVDLTSSPRREAANRLYRRLGFEERTTNVYRHNPGSDEWAVRRRE
ncbi:MAG: GNAT family N-acetyltransferase [Microthrixaceae bacterium]